MGSSRANSLPGERPVWGGPQASRMSRPQSGMPAPFEPGRFSGGAMGRGQTSFPGREPDAPRQMAPMGQFPGQANGGVFPGQGRGVEGGFPGGGNNDIGAPRHSEPMPLPQPQHSQPMPPPAGGIPNLDLEQFPTVGGDSPGRGQPFADRQFPGQGDAPGWLMQMLQSRFRR